MQRPNSDLIESQTRDSQEIKAPLSPSSRSTVFAAAPPRPFFNRGASSKTAVPSYEPPYLPSKEDSASAEPELSPLRATIRELSAEFIGTMLFMIVGLGVNCQATLTNSPSVTSAPKGNYVTASIAWGAGLALGAWVSGGISGGHLNPAVTLVQAIFRGFSWKKVPGYMLAQTIGACVGAGLVYANYYRAIDLFEGAGRRTVPGTAGLFATFPTSYLSNAQAFYQEALGTFLLVFVILAVTDKRNGRVPDAFVPLVLFFTLLAAGQSNGAQTGYSLNPARDLGPRLMCWFVGYGREVWNFRGQYWLYAPIIGPIVGGLVAAVVYDLTLYTGENNIFYARFRKDPASSVEEGEAGVVA